MSDPSSFVYVIGQRDSNVVKIGVAADVVSRLRYLRNGSPARLFIRAHWAGDVHVERFLHHAFAERRLHLEWFDFGKVDPVQAIAAVLGRAPLPSIQSPPYQPTPAQKYAAEMKRRSEARDGRRNSLLSGIAECSVCSAKLLAGRRDKWTRTLRCPSLRHVARRAIHIERVVLTQVLAVLSEPDMQQVVTRTVRGRDKERLRFRSPSAQLALFADDRDVSLDIASVWDNQWSLGVQRGVIKSLFRIVVLPGRPGRGAFDAETVQISWAD